MIELEIGFLRQIDAPLRPVVGDQESAGDADLVGGDENVDQSMIRRSAR